MDSSRMRNFKCVLLGDSGTGKMSLATRYASGEFSGEQVAEVFKAIKADVTVGREELTLHIWVTSSRAVDDQLRSVDNTDVNIFIICFNLMSRMTMRNVEDVWVHGIGNLIQNVPVMLVGTKLDLRADEEAVRKLWEDKQERPISTAEGKELASALGATCYMECSSRTGENVNETMDQAVLLVQEAEGRKRRRKKMPTNCMLM